MNHSPLKTDVNITVREEEPLNLGPFKLSPQQLQNIFTLNQRRKVCEELDFLEQMGGLSMRLN